MTNDTQLLIGRRFIDALLEAEVVRPEDHVRRVVIEADHRGAVTLYVERFGDERLLKVLPSLVGVAITTTDRVPPEETT